MAAVKCCVRKSRFFAVQQQAWCGFQHHQGEYLFCFLFSDPIIAGLTTSPKNSGDIRKPGAVILKLVWDTPFLK